MPKALEAQRDFSAGEIDVSAKRSDQSAEIAPLLKAGLRQALNMRIRNSKALRNRPGRRVLQITNGRVDEVTIAPGVVFRLGFTGVAGGTLNIFDTNGALVFTQAGLGWTWNNIQQLTWAVVQTTLYIAGPSFQPKTTTWSSGTVWSAVTAFNGLVSTGGQNRRFFYRISAKGITMAPSAATGNITLTFSSGILVAGHVNTFMRYIGRQVKITSLVNASVANATVIEPLPGSQVLTPTTDPTTTFNLGDEIIGSVSGAKGIIVGPLDATHIGVQLLSVQSTSVSTVPQEAGSTGASTQIQGFLATDIVAGPGGSVALSAAGGIGAPNGLTLWDEEVMNPLRGWPACVFSDQNRLGFCNFPAVPNAIGWSAIGNPGDMYVGGQPSNAMFELAPDKVQVQHVLAGPESSEFVFTDRKVYYIPISATNPLAPGRVAFNILSSSGALPVQPRVIDEDIVYVDSQNTVYSITAPGMYYRPYGVRNLTVVSTHIVKNPVALAVPTQQGTFAEQYIYVLNADGTLAVAKYETENGQIKGVVGWVPWSGNGAVSWVSARDAQVLFTTTYPGAVSVLEALDDTLYLDATMPVNAAPTALAPPGGKGPLWWMAGQTADLMDQDTRMMGTYQIDANGFIVPQNNGGEDLTAASLVAGQFFQCMVEPFLPAAPPGPDAHQRMTKRRISRFGAHVSRSTGFCFVKIATRIGPQLPPVGTVTIIRRVPAWNQDDDPTLAPPLRETSHNTRPSGRDFDPRVGLMKDTPGPWEILEIGMEAST